MTRADISVDASGTDVRIAMWSDDASLWREVWPSGSHGSNVVILTYFRTLQREKTIYETRTRFRWERTTSLIGSEADHRAPTQVEVGRLKWVFQKLRVECRPEREKGALAGGWRDEDPSPGRLTLTDDELEVFLLLHGSGAAPYLWPDLRFLDWAVQVTR